MRFIKLFIILWVLSFSLIGVFPTSAQPWMKKVAKGVFTLKTFTADGTLLSESNGFFVDEQGTALSCFFPFKGAANAVVIDAQGKEWTVDYMLGANETYDVAKFHVAAKKTTALTLASQKLDVGSQAWILKRNEMRNATQTTISKAETFMDSYAYYTLTTAVTQDVAGSPLFNDEGSVVALMQLSSSSADTLSYAVSALFADSLRINGLSINDPVLRSTQIKKALPDHLEQAVLTLYMAVQSMDSLEFTTLVNDFIAKFPDSPDGYEYRAQLALEAQHFDAAANDMERAISVATKKDEAHSNYSNLIYQKEIYMSDVPYDAWSLDKALDEARQAENINPLAVYRRQQAIILYAQKKYDEAYDIYTSIFNSELRSADLFYEASRCKVNVGDTTAVQALLDSCVATFNRPYLKDAAPYIFARAQAKAEAAKYRDAVNDYNDYENLMPTEVGAEFYYYRFQAEVGGRLFQQALNDISKAIEMRPDYELYLAEKASLQVRVGQYKEATETAEACIKLAPGYSDGYLFLGLAQCLMGKKEEGVKNLQKAKELGDSQADNLIEKYAKD